MPLNERDVVATVAEVRAAGPTTPRALRRAVAARLGLNTKDEAVLFEQYAGCLKDAAAASSNDAAAGEEKFDAIAIEASAAPFEDDSFASASSTGEPEIVELLAALSSGNSDTPARKRETRPARIPSSSADEADRVDKAVDAMANLISCLESQLAKQREAGEDEAAAATEAELEKYKDKAALLLRRFDELRGREALEAKLLNGIDRGEMLRQLTLVLTELDARLVAQQEAGDHEAASATLAEIELWERRSNVLLRGDGILPRTDESSASSSSYTIGASDASSDDDVSSGVDFETRLVSRTEAKLAAVVAELEARHNRRISVRVKKRFKRVWGRVLGRRSRGGEEE